jgi:DNA replication protein DnaC
MQPKINLEKKDRGPKIGEYLSMIITTNKAFGRWSEIMSDEAVASATLDRLLHHAHILSLKGDSYRMKDRLKAGILDFN